MAIASTALDCGRPTPFERWRARARRALAAQLPPDATHWGEATLLTGETTGDSAQVPDRPVTRIPARLVDLLQRAACHRDPAREARMYRLLWRMTHGEPALLDDAADDDVIAVTRMAKAVDRATHKMRAFVRFREVTAADGPHFIAWFEPEHDVLLRNAPFFVNRFASMHWTIATPDGAIAWDGKALQCFDVDPDAARPEPDAAEALWLTYYQHIFNPARLNVPMMRKEMPLRYWKNLPEASRIPDLVQDAMSRAGRMVEETMTQERRTQVAAKVARPALDDAVGVPTKAKLDACRRCPLGALATQGVPGAGPSHARVMLVGEQPGDEEDLAGKPFVGPAGKVLRRALDEAGLDVETVYVTNAVKHFSFEPRGKRRIHKTPAQREIEACHAWLDAEVAREAPAVIVALGATALNSLLGKKLAVGAARDMTLAHASGATVLATYHPSAVLRDPTEEGKAARYRTIVEDLRNAARIGHVATGLRGAR